MIKRIAPPGSGAKIKGLVATNKSQSAAKAVQALNQPAAISDSGKVAVASNGTTSKIKDLVGGGLRAVGKILPGALGGVASVLGNLFNDPEWWESNPGNELTLNDPLRIIDGEVPAFADHQNKRHLAMRYAIAEFTSWHKSYESSGNAVLETIPEVISPSDNMITQYLMPEIRRVVNAVPLQDASAYKDVLKANVAIYAIWQQLRKYDYMLKHGTTYIANLNDVAFPIFKTENASWLQSTIKRLEEYIKANVRLPHTLCEYIAWRFGRVYKSNDSGKSGIILYDAMPMRGTTALYDAALTFCMNRISSTTANQAANTDLYNAYYNHDYLVTVKEDTQFIFDKKEFCLRCNLTGVVQAKYDASGEPFLFENNAKLTDLKAYKKVVDTPAAPVMIDSSLDNKTAFMASTVSALGIERGSQLPDILFPVNHACECFIPNQWYDGVAYRGFANPDRKSVV